MASADEFIAEKSFLVDPAGELDIGEVENQTFTPFTGMLARGYTPSVVWIRLTIAPQARTGGELVLRIQPTYLDAVTLYRGDTALVSGDYHPISNDTYQSRHFNFLLQAPNLPQQLYLRVETSSTMLIHPQLFRLEQALRSDRKTDMLAGLFVGVLAIILFWGVAQWIRDREWVVAAFALKQAAVLTHALGYMGYWRVWLSNHVSPALLNDIYNFNIYLMTASAIWFIGLFLKEYRPNRFGLNVMFGLIGLLPLQIALQLSGHLQLAVHSVSIQALFIPVIAVALAFTARIPARTETEYQPVLSKRALIAFFLLLLAVLWIYVLPVLGLITFSPLTLNGILLYNLITSLMMFLVLWVRARDRAQQIIQKAEHTQFYKEEMRRERDRSDQQARFLAMLAHEIKTPLATIQMVTREQHPHAKVISKAVQDMDQVIDRCIDTMRFDDHQVIPHENRFDINALLQQSIIRPSQPHARVRFYRPSQPIEVVSDEQIVKTIIDNLIDNALKYGDPEGSIEVSVHAETQPTAGVSVAISNQLGPNGAPDPTQIFDKYYRGQTARRRTGSGLGLYLAKGFAELINGRLTYSHDSSDAASPITLTLWLPA